MKAFIVLAVVACASANPGLVLNGLGLSLAGHHTLLSGPALYSAHTIASPVVSQAIVAPLATKTQYHAQDELGQASFGHAEPGQAHSAVRDALGNVAGSYAYINPEGKEVRVSYTAGHGGFRVASNDLPVAPVANLVAPTPVEETPEVAQARAAHAQATEEARAKSGQAPPAAAPLPDTPEVQRAKQEHAKAVEEAKARNAAAPQSRRKRGIIAAPLAYSAIAPAAVTYHAVAAPAAVIAAPAVREATLTKVINTPGHAVSYRVD